MSGFIGRGLSDTPITNKRITRRKRETGVKKKTHMVDRIFFFFLREDASSV